MSPELHSAKVSGSFLSARSSKEIKLDLSVVIIGRNEAAHLDKCIKAALDAGKLTGRRFEVIYVDSASTDDSTLIASQYPISVIRIAPGEWRCAAAGRSIGTRLAQGKYLAFLDGDMICDPNWFKNALAYFSGEYGNVGAVTGKRVNIDINRGGVCSVRQCYTNVVNLDRFSGAVIISQCGIEASGGFDPYLIAFEERELVGRIRDAGFRVLGVPHAMVEHYGPAPGVSETLRRRNCGYHIGLGQYVRRLWIARKRRTALLEIKVQILFWIWTICFGVAIFATVWHNTPWIAMLAICTIPIVTAVIAFRLKNVYRSIIFFLAQPLITKGVIQGLFRLILKEKYAPATSMIREGQFFQGCLYGNDSI